MRAASEIRVVIGTLLMFAALECQAATVTISSTNDGMIDQHVNYNTDPVGVANYGHSHGPGAAKQHIVVGRLADDYTNPVSGPSKAGVMKFDVSSLAGKTVTAVTLRLIQTADNPPPNRGTAVFAPTTEVYGVNIGDFDEATSTWQNYIGGVGDAALASYLSSGSITNLGSMNNVASPGGNGGPGGVVTFSAVGLNSLVQSWIDNSGTNLGLVLLNSATLSSAPTFGADVIARYAAHENELHAGPELIVEYVPEPSAVVSCFLGVAAMLVGSLGRVRHCAAI